MTKVYGGKVPSHLMFALRWYAAPDYRAPGKPGWRSTQFLVNAGLIVANSTSPTSYLLTDEGHKILIDGFVNKP